MALPRRAFPVLIVVALLALGVRSVHALNQIALQPERAPGRVGEPLDLQLSMSFSDATLGGGVEIRYDPAVLRFDSFAFDPELGDDPLLRLAPPDGATVATLIVAFGSQEGLTGTRTVGAFVFTPRSSTPPAPPPDATLVDTAANATPAGPFVAADGLALLEVWFAGSEVVLPEPRSGALAGAALATLAAIASRRRRGAAGSAS